MRVEQIRVSKDHAAPRHQHSARRSLRRYAAHGHRRVQGWLSETAIALLIELARIQDRYGISGPVCEIGVHHGRLFILLHLLTRADERSVAWDLFEDQAQNVDRSGKGDRDKLEENLRRNACDLARITTIKANSLRLRPQDIVDACGAPPRMFSVDGGHTADVAYADLALAARAVRDDGLIVLDDFFNESWPGVAEATCRYFAAAPVPLYPVAIAGNKFVLTRNPEMAEVYQRELSLAAPRYRRRNTFVFGHAVAVFTAVPMASRLVLWRSRVGRRVRRSAARLAIWRSRAARRVRRSIAGRLVRRLARGR